MGFGQKNVGVRVHMWSQLLLGSIIEHIVSAGTYFTQSWVRLGFDGNYYGTKQRHYRNFAQHLIIWDTLCFEWCVLYKMHYWTVICMILFYLSIWSVRYLIIPNVYIYIWYNRHHFHIFTYMYFLFKWFWISFHRLSTQRDNLFEVATGQRIFYIQVICD